MKHEQETVRAAIVDLFYKGLDHSQICKKLQTALSTVSKTLTEHLKNNTYIEKGKITQVKAIEAKLFHYLEKEDKTIADNKIIDELTPIYARFCAA